MSDGTVKYNIEVEVNGDELSCTSTALTLSGGSPGVLDDLENAVADNSIVDNASLATVVGNDGDTIDTTGVFGIVKSVSIAVVS